MIQVFQIIQLKGFAVKLRMIALFSMTAALALAAPAQSQTLSVSPIPDGVENRFCYYAGLAYSPQSYIIITGSNSVTTTSNEVQERLLQCVASDEGPLHWVGRSKVRNG